MQFHNGTFFTGWVNASFERKESVVDTDFPGGNFNKIFEMIELEEVSLYTVRTVHT